MNGIWINPQDIGASSEYSLDWIRFIQKFGYVEGQTVPNCILLVEIKVD